MAKSDKTLMPSVLDRLIDESPEDGRELPPSASQVMQQIRRSVRRDLENLLNTRCRVTSWPENLSELVPSIIDYGIPDVTGTDLQSSDSRRTFMRAVEEAIRKYEPRLESVSVVREEEQMDRSLHFRIEAIIQGDIPEPIVFDSAVEPSTGQFSVQGMEQ